jgi:hypothetical protein
MQNNQNALREHYTNLEIETPHYTFQMTVKTTLDSFADFHFIVGDVDQPCLEGTVRHEYLKNNQRYKKYEFSAKLIKIEALQECVLNDITTDYFNQHSFGKEMLDAVVYFINCQFPQIKTVSFDDMSNIHCTRNSKDILDLISYSVALYKKTWYEEKLNAYFEPKELFETYRKQVEAYASKETKDAMYFEDFVELIRKKGRIMAIDMVLENTLEYKQLFENAQTLPDFFRELSKRVPREMKCNFFSGWLNHLIASKIHIERTWYFDLYPKIKVIQSKNRIPVGKNTRRRARK